MSVALRNDLHRTLVVERCANDCAQGDRRYDRVVLAPGQIHAAGHVPRYDFSTWAVSTQRGRELGCVTVYTPVEASVTVPLSALDACG